MTFLLSIFIIIGVSYLIVRIATVALTLTGMDEEKARFQALSAFTGTGFTTTEAEIVVKHPVRRKIVMTLMVLGNAGLASVIASLILSLAVHKAKSLKASLTPPPAPQHQASSLTRFISTSSKLGMVLKRFRGGS